MTAKAFNLPFPLRHDWIAHLQLPRDLTEWEAKRIAAMVLTLGVPQPDRKLLANPATREEG